MANANPRPGFSLLELLLVVTLGAVLLTLALPPLTRTADRIAVRRAAYSVRATIARARVLATLRGGAAAQLSGDSASVWVASHGDTLGDILELDRDFGVTLEVVSRSDAAVEISFDALGIGRFANRSLALRRGDAVVRLAVSNFGRVRER